MPTSFAGLRKATSALLCLAAALLPARATAAEKRLGAAALFPNTRLVNQDGKEVRFYDDLIQGRVVLVNFIFTTCQGPCPLETAKLRQVQELLGDRVGREIFMYSISIDPDNDTPPVLKAYMAKFKVRPGWQFFTGDEAEIRSLRSKLGLYSEDEERTDHTAMLLVGNDTTGQWLRRSAFDHPRVLASVLGERLTNYRKPRPAADSYAAAPKLRVDPGEDLFRRRCQACHTVGGGNALGPDLLGVTARRERDWLVRWMKRPDEMLAAKDPIATELFHQYKQLHMPNLQLGDNDVEQLLGYLERETQRALGDAADAPGARR